SNFIPITPIDTRPVTLTSVSWKRIHIPFYAFICGILRMLSGRTVQAVTGAVFGPILGGLLYRRFHSLWAAALGEVIGTGFFGAIASSP
ncbi:energy coupling factor transporter S component ThiW, partial [[Clostridium] symbiosum]